MHSRGSPTKGNKIRSGCLSGSQKRAEMLYHPWVPKEGGNAIAPLHSRGSPTEGNKIRSGCLTPPFSGAQKRAEVLRDLRSRGSRNKGTKSKVAHKWVEVLRKPYVLRGPRKGVQKWPAPGSWKKSHSGKNIGPNRPRCLTRPVEKSLSGGQNQKWPTSCPKALKPSSFVFGGSET